MAKYGAPLLVDVIRGKINGVVFTKARSGPTIRVRVRPANPRTTAQLDVRAYLTTVSRQWAGLTSGQRTAWDTYGSGLTLSNGVGGTFHPSGSDAYTRLSAKFLQIAAGAGTPPTTPPATPFAGDSITIVGSAGSGTVTFTPSASNGSGIKTELLIQPLKSAGRSPSPGGYRTNQFHTMSGTTAVNVTVPPGYYALAVKFVLVATGEQTGLIGLGVFHAT